MPGMQWQPTLCTLFGTHLRSTRFGTLHDKQLTHCHHTPSRPTHAGDFWVRAVEPVTTLLARNNLSAADLAGVQLLGGTSRVPRIKAALSEALGGRALDM